MASLLLSAELYCRAGSLILRSDAVKPLLGHNTVIQALAQKGLYVTDQDRLVTERDLTSTPIRMVRMESCLSCTHTFSFSHPPLISIPSLSLSLTHSSSIYLRVCSKVRFDDKLVI